MANSRPIISLYSNDRFVFTRHEAARVAHATTVERAVSAAMRKVLLEQYRFCVVFNGIACEMYRVAGGRAKIQAIYVDPGRAHWLK